MIGWLVALGVLLIIALVAIIITLTFMRRAELDCEKYRSSLNSSALDNQSLTQQVDGAIARQKLIEGSRTLERIRYEAIIDNLKKEIGTLEKDLAQIRDPAVVRDRLRRLLAFGTPESSKPTDNPAGYGQMPYGSTPKR